MNGNSSSYNYYPYLNGCYAYAQPQVAGNGIANVILAKDEEIRELVKLNSILKSRVEILEQQINDSETLNKSKPQIYMRRKINKNSVKDGNFRCPYPGCQRSYLSTLSLNLHTKLKHNSGTKKQREAYAKLIVKSEMEGTVPPTIDCNFPPNFMKNFRIKHAKLSHLTKSTESQNISNNQLQRS